MRTVHFGIIGDGLMGRESARAAARWCQFAEMDVQPEIVALCDPQPALPDWNPQAKSGRSLRITSAAATDKVCLTPTRTAIEATEDDRQAHELGRGGGITNGWEFRSPKT